MTLTSGLMTAAAGAHSEGAQRYCWVMDLTLAGRCMFRLPNVPAPVRIESGDVVFIRPGVFMAWRVPPAARGWRPVWFVFNPRDYVLEWLRFPDMSDGVYKLSLGNTCTRRMVSAAMLEAHRLATTSFPGHEELAMNALERAILWCRSNHLRALKPLDPRVEAALRYLHQRLGESGVRIADIVGACRTSRSRLLYLFRRQVGMPLMDYLEQERMRRAGQLLDTRLFSVKQVAGEVGYPDPKHFTRRFKKLTGLPPRLYRKR